MQRYQKEQSARSKGARLAPLEIAAVPLTVLIVGARAELLRDRQNTGPQLT